MFSQNVFQIINARRTESSDAPAIHDLISSVTTSQFGHIHVVHLIEKSNLSVTLNNEDNEVIGERTCLPFYITIGYPAHNLCHALSS